MSKGAIYFIGFILLCGTIFYLQLKRTGAKYEDLTTTGKHTTGKVNRIYKGIEYSYYVGGKLYKNAMGSYPRGIVDGEEFSVYFDSNEPENSVIDFYQPTFDTLFYEMSCTTSFCKVNGANKGLVTYSYSFEGESYSRFQRLVYDGLSNKERLQIFVKKSDPQIAYLTKENCRTEE